MFDVAEDLIARACKVGHQKPTWKLVSPHLITLLHTPNPIDELTKIIGCSPSSQQPTNPTDDYDRDMGVIK